jgi:acyl carrier protein
VAKGAGELQRLVAYVAPVGSGELDRQELANFVADQLPEHMVHGAVVVLPSLPITANGKIDRAALPEPTAADRVTRASVWTPPAGDEPAGEGLGAAAQADPVPEADPALLSVVSDLVCQLLELPSVDPQDNFFLLGGHSMLGAQLVAHLDEIFGVQLPLRDIFQNPTVAGIASQVEQAMVADLDVLSDEEAERLADALPGA